MSSILQHISKVLSDDGLDNIDQNNDHLVDNVKQNWVVGDEYYSNIPGPVYSYIRPKM